VLTRERAPSALTVAKATAVIGANKLDVSNNKYQITDQTDCPLDKY
jgi:hypothetical protein